jgi:hypothetical protein
VSRKYLSIYLNDQLALGIAWREVAKRAARENRGGEHADALARVAIGIAEDVLTFEAIMDRLGIRKSRVKRVGAVAGERLGRLKLNGHVTTYSPLSRFVELDFLAMGIEGKKILWQNLRDLARIPGVDYDALIARADEQRSEIEPARIAAGEALRLGGTDDRDAPEVRRDGDGRLDGEDAE